jgi:hypothetical protein
LVLVGVEVLVFVGEGVVDGVRVFVNVPAGVAVLVGVDEGTSVLVLVGVMVAV